MSGSNTLKRFFSGSRVVDSHSSGQVDGKSRRPGAKAMLAAGLTSLMLVAGAMSPAWAQEGGDGTSVTPDSQAAVTEVQPEARPASPLDGWMKLIQENCDSVSMPGSDDAGLSDNSFSDGIFAMLGKTELGASLQEYAAERGLLVCQKPGAGMVDWSSIGSTEVLSSDPDYSPHPALGSIGEGGAAYVIGLQLHLKQQQKAGIAPSPQMEPADALLVNRLVRMDAALYMAEMAVDLKYNHGDATLYNAVNMMSRFERHASLSAVMINTLEEQARKFQPEHVKPAEGEAPASLTGITLDDGLRRAALDEAAATPIAASFDSIVLNGYEAYLELPAKIRAQAPPNSVSVSDSTLAKIGARPGGDGESTYLSGGHDLRSGYYLKTTSVDSAMRLADIMMRLAGARPPTPEGAEHAPSKPLPQTRTASYQSL